MLSSSHFEYQITQMRPEDVPPMVRLHRHIFPDYFLTHLGQEFLELFYNHLIPRPGYSFVARCNGQIIGFVTGTADPDQFYHGFYKHNFLSLARIVLVRMFLDPHVRSSIWGRLFHLRYAGRALLRSRPPQNNGSAQPIAEAAPTPHGIAHLLSIGVADDFRGQGVAESLSDRFCREAKEDGRRLVLLSVLAENARAIRFYTRTGWQLVEEGGSSLVFSRSLNEHK